MTASALRVGLVVPRFAPFHGGMETYTAHAAAALAAKGVDVTVVTQVPRGSGLPAREAHDGYTVERHLPAVRRQLRCAVPGGGPCGVAVGALRRRVGAQLPHAPGLAGGGACEGPTRAHPALPRARPHSRCARRCTGPTVRPADDSWRRAAGSWWTPTPRPAWSCGTSPATSTATRSRWSRWRWPTRCADGNRTPASRARRADRRAPGAIQAHRSARPRGRRAAQPGGTDPARRRRGRLRPGGLPGTRRSTRGPGCRDLHRPGRRGDARTLVGVGVAVRDRESAGGVRHWTGPRHSSPGSPSSPAVSPLTARSSAAPGPARWPSCARWMPRTSTQPHSTPTPWRGCSSPPDSRTERAARCALPSAAQMADQLLETLTSVRVVSRP